MNYKLSGFFIKMNEPKGLIENNGKGIVELAIVKSKDKPIENIKTNILINPHGKTIYDCKEDEVAYARAVTHIFSASINVLDIEGEECVSQDNLMGVDKAIEIIKKYI